ncbi:MAG TPA: 1-aminocyclopropane-1-carboxylate deaminase, partial [Flavisolibacter sp.]|nr:1-aminocyclopropane-1-carboxylate deaminase [Flavisolibacter sp.]
TDQYTHIITAVGTGTTLAGLVAAAGKQQQVIGISVLKNNDSVVEECQRLLADEQHHSFQVVHDYHFGGYAKHKPLLLEFMNRFYEATGVPTDFVYTGKTFYAAFDLLRKGFFTADDKVLLIHTGGLQGNRSLAKGTLFFE